MITYPIEAKRVRVPSVEEFVDYFHDGDFEKVLFALEVKPQFLEQTDDVLHTLL